MEIKSKKAESENIYQLFYKRGVGLIGLKSNDKPLKFIVPNKPMNGRSYVAYGCETFDSKQEMYKCTQNKILAHIKANYNAPKKIKEGRILLKVRLGTDGAVEEVEVVESLKKAKKQEKEAIRVLQSLPKFIPAQVDDNKPIKVTFNVPFKF